MQAGDEYEHGHDDRTVMRRPNAVASSLRLLCSVGRFGVNRADDVVLVRALLAAAMATPALVPAGSDRRCDRELISTIELYQRNQGYAPPYGRVDPASTTLEALGAI